MKLTTALSFLGALTLSASAFADTVNLAGDTTGAPLFTRPTETGARSFFSVPYNVYQFNVTTSGQFTFNLTALDPSTYDTFLHLFVDAFNPMDLSDPAANFLAANDDLNPNDPTLGSRLLNVNLTAGTTYFLVVDGFFGTDAGAYAASITGPGTINVVPEPSTTALCLFALAGIAFVARRQVRRARA